MESRNEGERVAQEYSATLSELNSISKVEINALTMLAEDSKEFAIQVAGCIESHLKSVPSKKKLPILYLIDSICKNNPKSIYVQLFTQNIVSNFCNVFEVSGEKVRKSLHKLRMTWETMRIFPQKKLEAIDERVHKMDSNWPVLHKKQPTKQQPSQVAVTSQAPSHLLSSLSPPDISNTDSMQEIFAQQPKPLHQQTLLPQSLSQVTPQSIPLAPSSQPPLSQLPVPDPMTHFIPMPVDPVNLPVPQTLDPLMPVQPIPMMVAPLPILDLNVALDSLYGGKQCSGCSIRFDDQNKYAIHLDWHFRQNLKGDIKLARRRWFYPLNLWVQFRDINDDENNKPEEMTNTESTNVVINDHEVPTALASKCDEMNICSVCGESFEKFWFEEEEEWRLKNALLHDDERVYHPPCLMDMLQANEKN